MLIEKLINLLKKNIMNSDEENNKGLNEELQILISILSLVILFPLILLIGIAIKIDSKGPIFYLQKRIGKNAKSFYIYKFRTMSIKNKGLSFTTKKDKRITRVGSILRLFKLDEIPQLINIANGTMVFVGPRPEVPEYVDINNKLWKETLSVKPGFTDPTIINLRNEEDLLEKISNNKEEFYKKFLIPYKLKGHINYIKRRTALKDIHIIFLTIFCVIFPKISKCPTLEEIKKCEIIS